LLKKKQNPEGVEVPVISDVQRGHESQMGGGEKGVSV